MQKRTVPTPTTSQEISPPKRIKINATRSKESISELEKLNHVDTKMENSNEQESGPLRSIPLPVLLLAQAQIHQSSLINLQPILSLPPDPSTSTYAETYVHYVRSLGSAVAALRCIINNGNNGGHGMGGGRIELRARCELAEFLIRYLNTKPDGGSNMSLEVEGIISKGIAAAQKVSFLIDTWSNAHANASTIA